MEKIKRYTIFIIGLFINSLGVSLVTQADLGTSPISSIPYVLSLNFSLSLGEFTIIFSILLIILQVAILRKNFKIENLLQIPVSIAFGYFIDITMILLKDIDPQTYIMKLVYLIAGCAILGIGVYMEVLADVVMLPGESFVRSVIFHIEKEFGAVKIFFDSTLSLIAVGISFVFAGSMYGVREGTVIAAFLVGFVARNIGKKLDKLPDIIFGSKENEEFIAE